jgi:hypothetical protein
MTSHEQAKSSSVEERAGSAAALVAPEDGLESASVACPACLGAMPPHTMGQPLQEAHRTHYVEGEDVCIGFTECRCARCIAEKRRNAAQADIDLMDLCQCQGCGEYGGMAALGMSHACHRAEDGTYEEGGTFQ